MYEQLFTGPRRVVRCRWCGRWGGSRYVPAPQSVPGKIGLGFQSDGRGSRQWTGGPALDFPRMRGTMTTNRTTGRARRLIEPSERNVERIVFSAAFRVFRSASHDRSGTGTVNLRREWTDQRHDPLRIAGKHKQASYRTPGECRHVAVSYRNGCGQSSNIHGVGDWNGAGNYYPARRKPCPARNSDTSRRRGYVLAAGLGGTAPDAATGQAATNSPY
jgi:hypothetical protein